MAAYISFQPTDFFNTKLYTGTASQQAITGVGFQPDFTWIKRREVNWHCLVDAVRGATKRLSSNVNNAEVTDATAVESLDTDGFTVGIDSNGYTNQSGGTYASWNWKMGTTTGIGGSPSITPSGYSFNQTSGVSAVTYTGNQTDGDSIPHGLGKSPTMLIVKQLGGASNWMMYHVGMGGPSKYIELNATGASGGSFEIWNNTIPTTTVWESDNDTNVNGSGQTYVCYAFTDIRGFSRFSSYKGNGNADGPMVYTGFRPAFVMCKRAIGGASDWELMDNKRLGYNSANYQLYPNESNAEGANSGWIDLLSNGFKITTSDSGFNINGDTYIYAAFAEFPFVSSNSKPGTARQARCYLGIQLFVRRLSHLRAQR